jgi:uncharacterized membrane protein YadS
LGVVSTIALGGWLAKRIDLKTDFGLLCGAADSICGACAALAVSAVMPKTRENEQHTLLAVIGVTGGLIQPCFSNGLSQASRVL